MLILISGKVLSYYGTSYASAFFLFFFLMKSSKISFLPNCFNLQSGKVYALTFLLEL
jgi:hypothetical protein